MRDATTQHESGHHDTSHHSTNRMAANATLHCLTGCSIGEITGLLISRSLGWGTVASIAIAVGLAFCFGYLLSSLPLVRAGLGLAAALQLVLAADTLSILTMEIVDNAVMLAVPGAMEASLGEGLFWASMTVSLGVAYLAAFPVNKWLLGRGKGHAHTHEYMGAEADADSWRRFVPDIGPGPLAAAIIAFLAGAAPVAVAG